MKKLAIAGLSTQERSRLIETAKQNIKTTEDQALIVEALTLVNDILEKHLSLAKLKSMLGLNRGISTIRVKRYGLIINLLNPSYGLASHPRTATYDVN